MDYKQLASTLSPDQLELFRNKYGCWVVGSTAFKTKFEAIQHGTSVGIQPHFYYHDHIWNNLDRSLLGKTSLPALYKERAQQLRDKYDHLVLHYSGGSDSHNILETFLQNNIKLDEISVRWIKPLRDGKFYTPNNKDTSARNAASEWDYTIKPVLDKLKTTHPEITITVVDNAETLNLNSINSVDNIENTLSKIHISSAALGSIYQRLDPSIERKLSVSNKNVGHIFGIEKPLMYITDTDAYMFFQDSFFEPGTMVDGMESNIAEMFYWSADLPLLAMEQCYRVALEYKLNLKFRELFWRDGADAETVKIRLKARTEVYKKILYKDTWDFNKFQVDKPNIARSDWYFWLHESPELETVRENARQAMVNLTKGFDPKMVTHVDGRPLLNACKTRKFHILSLTQ